jgi:ammonia channel protein AmtB
MTELPSALSTIFTEYYYWSTVVFMFLIHIGFCMYEVGASRRKNHMHTLMKNTMLIPLVTVTFFFFGWWIYWAFPNGVPGIFGADPDWALADANMPTAQNMAPHMQDRITGVFWAAFLLFSWTAASIVSGAVIERIRSGAFWIIAVVVGSGTWMIDAAWGWKDNGWMVDILGYHDAYASGVIHAIAGGAALGVLVHLGPRIGKFRADGTPRNIVPQNPWLITIGLFLIYTGFWGFYVACNVPIWDIDGSQVVAADGTTVDNVFFSATTIYLTPTTLSGITFNFLMSLSGGLMAAYIVSRGDAFWTYSGGLAGVIGASAGNDLYHPLQAMIIGAGGAMVAFYLHRWVERRFRVDDAVGAVAVHGYAGFYGVFIAGFFLWGYPSSTYEGYAQITPWGQFIGALIMFLGLGFIPTWIIAGLMKAAGILRIPRQIELVGLDLSEYAARYMDEEDIQKAELEEARATGLLGGR